MDKPNLALGVDFVKRTNEDYAAWCKTFYQPGALDERGFQSLHGLWAWQEQERRNNVLGKKINELQHVLTAKNEEIAMLRKLYNACKERVDIVPMVMAVPKPPEFEPHQPTNVEDAAVGNVDAIRHIAYAEGYKDGKEAGRQETKTEGNT